PLISDPPSIVPFPTRRSSDLDEEVVKQALCAIADERGDDVVSALEVGLHHSAWHVRILAARLLADRGDARAREALEARRAVEDEDRKSTRLNSSHVKISYAVF